MMLLQLPLVREFWLCCCCAIAWTTTKQTTVWSFSVVPTTTTKTITVLSSYRLRPSLPHRERLYYNWPLRSSTESIITTTSNVTDSGTKEEEEDGETQPPPPSGPRIVLVAGFESFNRELYRSAAKEAGVNLSVFADSDIRVSTSAVSSDGEGRGINPEFKKAVSEADAVIASLVFDYDDVLAVKRLCEELEGPRFVFECATELMALNRIGSFSMATPVDEDGNAVPSGPPAPVKKVLKLFSSGKEEDKISGYLKFLKIGPSLLKYVPGEKASDLKTWLETYRYWNQGGKGNVRSMLRLVAESCTDGGAAAAAPRPDLEVTPDIGLIHPLLRHSASSSYIESPRAYLDWRFSEAAKTAASEQGFVLAPSSSPVVAVLVYRKHVITELEYLYELLTQLESEGIVPVPIFINGVEAHTIVRDLLVPRQQQQHHDANGSASPSVVITDNKKKRREPTFRPDDAVAVDAIVNTIGFPLVGGPAGSIEAGRNLDVSRNLLRDMNVPYL